MIHEINKKRKEKIKHPSNKTGNPQLNAILEANIADTTISPTEPAGAQPQSQRPLRPTANPSNQPGKKSTKTETESGIINSSQELKKSLTEAISSTSILFFPS